MGTFLRMIGRRPVPTFSILAVIVAVCAASGSLHAQGSVPVQNADPPIDKSKPGAPPAARTEALPPANPLVIYNPQDGSGNGAARFDRTGSQKPAPRSSDPLDYTSGQKDARINKTPKRLPIFGYSFFEPYRRVIRAKSARLERMFEDPITASSSQRNVSAASHTPSSSPGRERMTGGSPLIRVRTPVDDLESSTDTGGGPAKASQQKTDVADSGPYTDPKMRRASSDNGDANVGNDAASRAPRRRFSSASDSGDDSDDLDGSDADNSDSTSGMTATRLRRSDSDDDSDTDYSGAEENASSSTQLRDENGQGKAGVPPRRGSGQSSGAAAGDLRGATGGNSSATRSRVSENGVTSAGENPSSARNLPRRPDEDNAPINAMNTVVGPLDQIQYNVVGSAPSGYQLSGGDKLTIRYSSPTLSESVVSRTIDDRGHLTLPEAGTIILSGKTIGAAEETLQRAMRRYYRGVQVTVTLAELRTINVTVSGEAFLTGSYSVPAVASAYNMVSWAGGPTPDGSMRNIEVRRHGTVVGTLDLYRILTPASANQVDIPLQSGDQIYIAPAFARVSVRGEVGKEARYELKAGETLQDALRFAGGVKASGVDQVVRVDTVSPGMNRVLKDVNLANASEVSATKLYDGDSVVISSVRPLLVNKVTVEGAVDQPNDYALTSGMTVADLIKQAHGTMPEAFLSRAELFRWNPNNTTTLVPIDLDKALEGDPKENITLVRWDRLKVFSREEVAWTGQRRVTITGAVKRPGRYDLAENMRVSDLLLQAGGPLPDAYLDRAYLLHQHGNGTFDYEYVNIADVIRGDNRADWVLADNDRLAVYRVGEAQFTPEHVVTISGQVVAPGIYPRGEGMRLSDLLDVAGGFRPGAGLQAIIGHARKPLDGPDSAFQTTTVAFDSQHRCSPGQNLLLQDGDVVAIQGVGGFEDHPSQIVVNGAVEKPGPIILTGKTQRLSDAIKLAGGLRAEAFPEGAEFTRNSKVLTTPEQRALAAKISALSDLLNDSAFKREQAKSDVERMKAVSTSQTSASPLGGSSSTPPPDAGVLVNQLSQHELVSKPRVLTPRDLEPSGSIAINLPGALRRPGGMDDLVVVDGDTITVPERPTTVQVMGAVVNGRGVLWKPGAGVDYYVNLAGGFAPDAARDRMVVIHAGSGLIPANKIRTLEAGDILLVPTNVQAAKLSSNSANFDSFFRSLTSSLIIYRVVTSIFGL